MKEVCFLFLMALPLFGAFIATTSARAEDTGISGMNVEFYHPALDSSGYFGIYGASPLDQGQFSFKISQSVAYKHLFKVATATGSLDVVDLVATTNFVSAFGINRRLSAALDLPVHFLAREARPDTGNSFSTGHGGDIRLSAKFSMFDEKEKRPGLSLLVGTTFPTGNENKFLGRGAFIPEALLTVEKKFKYFSMALNAGGRFPKQKRVLGVDFNDEFVFGSGFYLPLRFIDPGISFVSEARGSFQLSDIQQVTTPIEYTLGFRKDFKSGLNIMFGGGGALTNAVGNPRFRGIFSVGFETKARNDP